jgi:hypothetical protein
MENQIIDVNDKLAHEDGKLSVAERKAKFIRQGQLYRVGVVRAKAQVLHEAQPQALFHAAVDHATFALRTRVDNLLNPTGFSVGSIWPYALPVLRLLRNRQFGRKSKLAMAAVALLGAAGVYYQQKRKREAAY